MAILIFLPTIVNCNIQYSVSQHHATPALGSLIDGGANGGISGSDVTLIESTMQNVDIKGLADQSIVGLPLCQVAGLIQTQKGPIIGIFNQYAHRGKGHTVHSVNQLKSFGIIVDDDPLSSSGQQCIITPDGYHIPISIRNGLPWMDMSAPNPTELLSYPHVIFTSDMPWDPQVHDHEYNIQDLEPPTDTTLLDPTYHSNTINDFGDMTFYSKLPTRTTQTA
jgi:hypothetical protein